MAEVPVAMQTAASLPQQQHMGHQGSPSSNSGRSGRTTSAPLRWQQGTASPPWHWRRSLLGTRAGAPEDELVDEQLELPGFAHALRLQSVSRAQRHTLAHTGLMLWEAAPVLSRLLLRCPSPGGGCAAPEVASSVCAGVHDAS